FRMGKTVMNTSPEEKILTALFLCSDKPNEILAAFMPEWNDKFDLPINEKVLIVNSSILVQKVFPWKDELSEGIDHEKFCESFLIQPDLFLRLRPEKEKMVKQKLQQAGMQFTILSGSCLALPNASKVDDVIELDTEAVIQDYSSQQTGSFISSAIASLQHKKPSVWDCCAASGGKSIMMYDINPDIALSVSDVREGILINLKKRFGKAGIKKYKSFVADISGKNFKPQTTNFKLIVADVPCTGSGTWSRTPEQLYFFDERKIETYSVLQKKIVSNAIPQLQTGGIFIYITCSVFKKENEGNVDFIKENFHLELTQMEVLKGYDKKADSMFVAVFKKNL